MFNTSGTLFRKGSLTSRLELFEKVNLLLQESAELQMRQMNVNNSQWF